MTRHAQGFSKAFLTLLELFHIIEGWGGETNREIDFGFDLCVHARGLVVRWE